jgi:PAS domain S-box-containing protein
VKTKNRVRYIYTILSVPFIVLARYAIQPLVGSGVPYITLFPGTVIVALLSGLGPAIVSGILSSIAVDYFFIPPLYAIELTVEGISRLLIVTLTSAFVGYVGTMLRTARDKAEEQSNALRVSEERFKAIASNTPDHIFVQDYNLRYAFVVNPQMGLIEREMIGKTDGDLLTPEDAAKLTKIKRQILETGKSVHVEIPLSSSKGEQQFFDGFYVPKFDADGTINGLIGYFRNVTDRKRDVAMLRGIMEASQESIWVFSPEGIILMSNGIALRRMGQTAEEIIGKHFKDILPEDLAALRLASLHMVVETGKPLESEDERNGIIFHHSWYPVMDSEGHVTTVTCFSRDITERKNWEKALRKERDFTTAVIETAGALVVVLDKQGRITRFNQACEFLTGYHANEVQGKIFWEFLIPMEDLAGVKNTWHKLRNGDFPNTHENHWLTNDGSKKLIAWSNTALVASDGEIEYIIATGIDITDRKKMEAELLKSHDELEIRVEERTKELSLEVAERKKAEDALRASSHYSRSLIEASLDPLVTISQSGIITDVNKATEHVTGVGRDQLIGTDFSNYFTQPEKAREGYQQVFAKGFVTDYPLTILHKNGWLTDVLYNATTYKDTLGNAAGVFAAARDVTEKKAAEAELEKYRIDLEQRHRELLTFFRLSEIVLSSISLEEFYDKIVDEICAATGFPIAGIGLYDEARQKILLRGLRTLGSQPERPVLELPVDGTPSGVVVRTGKPLIETRLHEDSKYEAMGLIRTQAQMFVGYPLKIGQNIIGCLNLLHTEKFEITEHMAQWIESLAHYVAVLTDRKRAEEELRLSREQLRELSKYTHFAIESERIRIAREIHDELGQQLSLLQLDLGIIQKKIPQSDADTKQKTASMIKLIDSTIRSVQRISTDLRPALLDDLGVGAAVEWAVKEFQKRTKIRCKAFIDPPDLKLDQERSTALFRILQEAFTNILRHSKATNIQVNLALHKKTVELMIRDNGIGISHQHITDIKSIGITGMRERVRTWGGNVTIVGEQGKKTEVLVTIPIDQ